MGTISLEGLLFQAFHGYYKEERKLGNTFTVDITIETDFQKASQQDDLTQTINYEEVYAIVKAEMEIPSKLLEHIIYRIQEKMEERFPQMHALEISISKSNPPIGGICDRARVSIKKEYSS